MADRKTVFWEVDTQADFMLPGGKLYVPGAEKIIPNIKRLVDAAREGRVYLVSHGCRHTPNDPEFKTFPPHCIRGTPGARIIPEGLAQRFYTVANDAAVNLPENFLTYQQIVLEKQTLDVFDNSHASAIVERLGKDVEYVVFGVATEYCVRLAAKGLLERGRRVCLVTDAIEALNPLEGRRAIEELKSLGAKMITTSEALAAVGSGSS
jgi:nicotinamidase/pyrazinamidase